MGCGQRDDSRPCDKTVITIYFDQFRLLKNVFVERLWKNGGTILEHMYFSPHYWYSSC